MVGKSKDRKIEVPFDSIQIIGGENNITVAFLNKGVFMLNTTFEGVTLSPKSVTVDLQFVRGVVVGKLM
jgi:hypothetical protein